MHLLGRVFLFLALALACVRHSSHPSLVLAAKAGVDAAAESMLMQPTTTTKTVPPVAMVTEDELMAEAEASAEAESPLPIPEASLASLEDDIESLATGHTLASTSSSVKANEEQEPALSQQSIREAVADVDINDHADVAASALLASHAIPSTHDLASMDFQDPGNAASLIKTQLHTHTPAATTHHVQHTGDGVVSDASTSPAYSSAALLNDLRFRELSHSSELPSVDEQVKVVSPYVTDEALALSKRLGPNFQGLRRMFCSHREYVHKTASYKTLLNTVAETDPQNAIARVDNFIIKLCAEPSPTTTFCTKELRKLEKSIDKLRISKDIPDQIERYVRKMMGQIRSLCVAKDELIADIKKDSIAPNVPPTGQPIPVERVSGRRGRSDVDVIDCVACRFAWLKVEMDAGNSQKLKQLYDTFVYHCSQMQEGKLFFHSCNKMFAQVDKMIGDYIFGYTVSQMCENAQMCR